MLCTSYFIIEVIKAQSAKFILCCTDMEMIRHNNDNRHDTVHTYTSVFFSVRVVFNKCFPTGPDQTHNFRVSVFPKFSLKVNMFSKIIYTF